MIAAVVLSLLLHALGLGVTPRSDQTSTAQDGASEMTDIGDSFEDVAETVIDAETPDPAPVPESPSVTSPEEVTEESPMTQALVASDTPQDVTAPDTGSTEVVEPDAAEPSDSEAVAPYTAEQSDGEDDRVEDMAALTPLESDTEAEAPKGTPQETPDPVAPQPLETAPVPPVETGAPAPSPGPANSLDTEPLQPVLPEITVAPQPDAPETLTAKDSEEATDSAVTTSLRPPKERPSAASGVPEGARTGRAAGTIESPLTTYKRTGVDPFASGGGGSRAETTGFSGSRNPGNARTTNYVGRVLMKLNRAPVVNPSAQGVARVSFEISSDGTVAWVKILGSSGSADIRYAAAAQVRSAAPFPPPPGGTSQRLVFLYRNR